jgi:hypothetical protein
MRRAGVVVTGLVTCGLLVSACGSGSPAATGNTASRTAAASTTSTEQTGPARVATQTVRIGRFTQVFDASLLADPVQASAVEGFRAAMVLWDESQEDLTLVPQVTAYVTAGALDDLRGSLVRTKAQDVILGGTDRFFKTSVTGISATSATITTCDDGSKFEEVNPGTGVPDPVYSAPPDQQYVFETWQMVWLDGRWAISVVTPVTLPGSLAPWLKPASHDHLTGSPLLGGDVSGPFPGVLVLGFRHRASWSGTRVCAARTYSSASGPGLDAAHHLVRWQAGRRPRTAVL